MLSKQVFLTTAASSSLFLLAHAQNSIPIATSPIVVTTTIPTVIESLSTTLSESTSTSNADQILTVTTTDSNGDDTTIISTATGAGAQARFIVTVTRVETVRVTSSTVVVSTIGSTTIFGPDTNTPTTSSEPPPPTTSSTSSEPPPPTSIPETSSAPPPPASTELTSSRTSPSSTFAIASPSPTSASSSSSSSSPTAISTGAKVGIALAAILTFALIFFLGFFMYKRHVSKRDDPYLPSASEKKLNKKKDKDGFVYDPEDTSYLNTPYAASQPGAAPAMVGSELASDHAVTRYEMPGTDAGMGLSVAKSTSASRSRSTQGSNWPMGPGLSTTASELEGQANPVQEREMIAGRAGWGRGPYEKG